MFCGCSVFNVIQLYFILYQCHDGLHINSLLINSSIFLTITAETIIFIGWVQLSNCEGEFCTFLLISQNASFKFTSSKILVCMFLFCRLLLKVFRYNHIIPCLSVSYGERVLVPIQVVVQLSTIRFVYQTFHKTIKLGCPRIVLFKVVIGIAHKL